jgi:putative ABC transport system substrate-binding protein
MTSFRRRQVLLAAGSQLLVALAVNAQRIPAKRRVGVLTGTNEAFFARSRRAFEAALGTFGWIPGTDVEINYRYSVGDETAGYSALTELLAAKVEVLVAAGAIPHATLRAVAPSVPVVALFSGDPVARGFAVSMARPGGNMTGVATTEFSDEVPKMMELLREAFPRMRRLGVLANGELSAGWRDERAAAARFGIELVPLEARHAHEVETAVAELARRKVDAIWVLFDPSWPPISEVARMLRVARMPAISDVVEFVEAGGLMAFGEGVEMVEVFRQLARFVDRILRGAAPGQLPIENPPSPRLALNARTARELGYVIPPGVQLRTDRLVD